LEFEKIMSETFVVAFQWNIHHSHSAISFLHLLAQVELARLIYCRYCFEKENAGEASAWIVTMHEQEKQDHIFFAQSAFIVCLHYDTDTDHNKFAL
jgi:hypothetical protein